MFNRMTEEEAVTKTKEKVKGLENQIAQKPRGWFPETVNDHRCQMLDTEVH